MGRRSERGRTGRELGSKDGEAGQVTVRTPAFIWSDTDRQFGTDK